MCTSPILIRNKKFRSLGDNASFVRVPCGMCDECLADRANNLYVLARMEYEHCLKNGGCGFMCTLTYSDDLLPIFEHNGKCFMVFNKKHIIDFIKRLRTKLDRFFKRHFNCSAPDFKYLVTCEYGTDPTKSHRPHYHILIFFCNFIGYRTFRDIFASCLSVRVGKVDKPVFGYIFQCDLLDPHRGGIKYSGKYVLKDLMYEETRLAIIEKIKFYTDFVCSKHHIKYDVSSSDDEFYNRCIRASKSFRKDVAKFVLPFRHMLQFYLSSNDLGASYIVKKYGESLLSLGCINFEGFPYKIPKLVKIRFEETYGSSSVDKLSKHVFMNYFSSVLNDLSSEGVISKNESCDLKDFVQNFIQPLYGDFYLVDKSSVRFSSDFDFDIYLSSLHGFYDNGFFELRQRVLDVLALYNSPERLEFRAKIAKRKKEEQTEKYIKRKHDKPSKLY